MKTDQVYSDYEKEARRLLSADGPEASFRYIAELRQQAPNEYRLEYLEQILRHEYEEDICMRALSLRDAGDPLGACSLLEEAIQLDSQRMKALYAEIRATVPIPLHEIPVLRDNTANAKTGAKSTIAWDQVLQDSFSNQYEHSIYADMDTVVFSLQGSYDLFAGTVAFPQGEKADVYRSTATLQVFGDGKLIAEFKDIDSSSAPIPFSIPVEGMLELSLSWTSEGANGWKDWGRFATIFDGRLLATAADSLGQ